MEENKIPTWEEMESSGDYSDYTSITMTYAKLHVKAALKMLVKLTLGQPAPVLANC